MEKLIELLNEYEKDGLNEFETYVERWYCERTYQILSGKWENNNELKPCEIISKRYGFIKWLVENDKIDYHNKINYHISLAIHWREKRTTREERLLMMLAIQDEPIKFLCSLLK